jgi:hypothetical protein
MIVDMKQLLTISLLAFAITAFAKDKQRLATVYCVDDSKVVGEVIQLKDGIYWIRTKIMGVVRIGVKDIANIEYAPPANAPRKRPAVAAVPKLPKSGGGLMGLNTDSMMKELTSNPELMKMIEGLAEDPQMKAVLEDPELMSAIERGDITKLFTSQKVRDLTENQSVKKITTKMTDDEAKKD